MTGHSGPSYYAVRQWLPQPLARPWRRPLMQRLEARVAGLGGAKQLSRIHMGYSDLSL